MTTPEALVTIRAYLAAKPMLSPDIRAALEHLMTALEEAERVIEPMVEAAHIYDEGQIGDPWVRPPLHLSHLRAARDWKRKHGSAGR